MIRKYQVILTSVIMVIFLTEQPPVVARAGNSLVDPKRELQRKMDTTLEVSQVVDSLILFDRTSDSICSALEVKLTILEWQQQKINEQTRVLNTLYNNR